LGRIARGDKPLYHGGKTPDLVTWHRWRPPVMVDEAASAAGRTRARLASREMDLV
jgi:hypothetical protein